MPMIKSRRNSRPVCFDSRTGLLLHPDCQFVVTPPVGSTSLSIDGVEFRSGQSFDRALVSARRLRQMYDARLLSMAPGEHSASTGHKPRSDSALRKVSSGIPRKRSIRGG